LDERERRLRNLRLTSSSSLSLLFSSWAKPKIGKGRDRRQEAALNSGITSRYKKGKRRWERLDGDS
jgi:hypothetical protein